MEPTTTKVTSLFFSYEVWCSETRVSLSRSFNTFNRLVFVQCSTEEVNRQTVEETETWSMRRKVRAARLMVTCGQYKAPNIWMSLTGETWLLSGVCRGSSLWQLLSFTDTLHLYETNRRKSQTYFWLSVSLWSHCSLTFVTFYKNTDKKNQTWSTDWIKMSFCLSIICIYQLE